MQNKNKKSTIIGQSMSNYVGPLGPSIVDEFDTIPKFLPYQHNKKKQGSHGTKTPLFYLFLINNN